MTRSYGFIHMSRHFVKKRFCFVPALKSGQFHIGGKSDTDAHACHICRSVIYRFGVGYRFITNKGVQTLKHDKTEEVPTLLVLTNLPFREFGVAKSKIV